MKALRTISRTIVPIAMKTLIGRFSDNLLALLVFALLFLFSFNVTLGQQDERVVIKGQVSLPRGNENVPYACLAASDGEEMEVVIRANGKFWVSVSENERYTMSFSQEGCYQKDVTVDTHNSTRSASVKKSRVIAFNVVLHKDDSDRRQRYDGAVGSIDFHKSNGRMLVKHHYQMVNGEQPTLAKDGHE